MEIEVGQLRRTYATRETVELVDLIERGGLTEIAEQTLREELASRSSDTDKIEANKQLESKSTARDLYFQNQITPSTPRHVLWWIYSIYPMITTVLGSRGVIYNVRDTTAWVSVAVDVLGLLCLYGFLVKKPIFSQRYWGPFAILYFFKLACVIALLASFVNRIPNGSDRNSAMLVSLGAIILGVPYFIAIIRYAFGSRDIWKGSRGASS